MLQPYDPIVYDMLFIDSDNFDVDDWLTLSY